MITVLRLLSQVASLQSECDDTNINRTRRRGAAL
jgi:hypothetical protein